MPPLSLYVHIPWCVRKCPYCDFNSHEAHGEIPTDEYVRALLDDLNSDAWMAQSRQVESVFFGGGTPSLLPDHAIAKILDAVDMTIGIASDAEITLEANPGTLEHHDFTRLRATSVNRLSMGVQSFNDKHLQALGRIHSAEEAKVAISRAQEGGFDNLNIDLMHGLPNQTIDQAMQDIHLATALNPVHISWYQLTIEQNTEFYSHPPRLPKEDVMLDIWQHGRQVLQQGNFDQYEISAYARGGNKSKHNLNYWQFGDYLALGAGAHGKITVQHEARIFRYRKTRLPRDYMNPDKAYTSAIDDIHREHLTIEFMMNALRLNAGASLATFAERTGQPPFALQNTIEKLKTKGLVENSPDRIVPTPMGRQFLNGLLEEFLTER